MMDLTPIVATVFQNPPLPFDPARQSAKAWAIYCLRDRGFMVVKTDKADLAIKDKRGKSYFNITVAPTEGWQPEGLDPTMGWIVIERSGQSAQVIAQKVQD
jgi:hypothetical protein